jgi:hypothetical protein
MIHHIPGKLVGIKWGPANRPIITVIIVMYLGDV